MKSSASFRTIKVIHATLGMVDLDGMVSAPISLEAIRSRTIARMEQEALTAPQRRETEIPKKDQCD